MLLDLDIRTLITILFWCNLTSAILTLSYHLFSYRLRDTRMLGFFLCAKSIQAAGYLLVLYRNAIPDLLSVNLGNSFLFIGFYFEALCALIIVGAHKRTYYLATFFLAAVFIIFNAAEVICLPANLRVSAASMCIFAILLIPGSMLVFKKNISKFKRAVGIYYILVLLMLLPRAIYMFINGGDIFTYNPFQVTTLLSLITLMVFTSSAYLLLIKEDTDKTINSLATTDFLTGLSNRYSFLANANRVFTRHLYSKEILAMLFCDIDNFKSINDRYGHMFGDLVLKTLADTITSKLRSGDLSCRYGGEEFLILLAQAGSASGKIVAERILHKLTNTVFEQYPDFRFTVSIGIAYGVPNENQTISTFIHKADQALYEAKNTGKNKFVEYAISE